MIASTKVLHGLLNRVRSWLFRGGRSGVERCRSNYSPSRAAAAAAAIPRLILIADCHDRLVGQLLLLPPPLSMNEWFGS